MEVELGPSSQLACQPADNVGEKVMRKQFQIGTVLPITILSWD